MFKVCEISAGELLGADFDEEQQKDFLLYGVSDPEAPEDHTLVFVKSKLSDSYKNTRNCIYITDEEMELSLGDSCIQIRSRVPKNRYGELLERMVCLMPKAERNFVNGSYISSDVQMGEAVKIGPFCVIGRNVVIGDHCEIGAGTVIKDHVRIGDHVIIKENCMIGVEDADIYRREDGFCRTLLHLAGTVIEDGCLLLAGAVLAAGDTRTTVLGRGSMIGLLGDVGHNCQIGDKTLVSGKASISGHCRVGSHTYIAPMSVTTNRMSVGDGAYLGIGAVAIRDVPDGEKQFGNPARKVLEMKK